MHIVVSWDISNADDQHAELNKAMRGGLDGYSWARPLTTFYVVRVESESDRATIRDRLLKVAQTDSASITFVVSPVMAGGRYDGFLPSDMWEKLNKRSDP
jgi:hypothetical protein